MAIATYKDLCIDAVDDGADAGDSGPRRSASSRCPTTAERLDLVGPTPQHRVWINKVPEPVTVKQRVHIDVHAASVGRGAGPGRDACRPRELPRGKSLKDPEGGELCVFEPKDEQSVVPAYKLYEVVVDSREATRSRLVGRGARRHRPGQRRRGAFSSFEDAPGMPFELVFGRVPEPKTVKNRIHWDVETTDVQALLDRGATLLRGPDDDIDWHVLADPEGNEFCACVPRE